MGSPCSSLAQLVDPEAGRAAAAAAETPASPSCASASAPAAAPRSRGGVYSVGFALVLCVVFSLSALLLVDHRAPVTVDATPQPQPQSQQQKQQHLLLGQDDGQAAPALWQAKGGSHEEAGDSSLGSQSQQLPAGEPTLRQLMEQVAQQHPIHRRQCGRWVQDYAKLHRAIVAGEAPQRYAVMRSRQEFGNGLADRLATSVTIFLYALLSNRAFQYDWDPGPVNAADRAVLQQHCGKLAFYEPSTQLWTALRSDFIDWRYTGSEAGNKSIVMDHNCDMQTDLYKSYFAETDVSRLHDEYHTVVWHADHAMVYAAFDNPLLAPRLAELGLQRETAFACMFDFLYRPTPEVLELFKPELSVLLDPTVLKLGVQIRVGDWQLCDSYMFKPQNYPSLFDHYFDCAREIEQELAAPGQRVVWYTLSDIPQLRQGLQERWAPRILVNTRVSVEHIVKSRNASQQGFFQAAGELWAFSLTSAHVITRKSGFGKVPAMVSANGTRHIFTVDYPMKFGWVGLDNRKNIGWFSRQRCITKHATPLAQVCGDFTGI